MGRGGVAARSGVLNDVQGSNPAVVSSPQEGGLGAARLRALPLRMGTAGAAALPSETVISAPVAALHRISDDVHANIRQSYAEYHAKVEAQRGPRQ